MTNRRVYIKQMAIAGIAGNMDGPFLVREKFPPVFSKNPENESLGNEKADITPYRPIGLTGQLHKRISELVQGSLITTVLALKTENDSGIKEQAIMVSCDFNLQERDQSKNGKIIYINYCIKIQ